MTSMCVSCLTWDSSNCPIAVVPFCWFIEDDKLYGKVGLLVPKDADGTFELHQNLNFMLHLRDSTSST